MNTTIVERPLRAVSWGSALGKRRTLLRLISQIK